MTDLRDSIRAAIANGVDPARLPGLDATTDRVVDAIDASERSDPRFGDPIEKGAVAGLAVAFKALVLRAGGKVEITEAELLAAEKVLMRVDATPEVMVVELAEGDPPDQPRYAVEP